MRRLFINGSPVTSKIDGLEDIVINISSKDPNLSQDITSTSELTFYGAGYNILFNALVLPPNPGNNFLKIKIWDDCCATFLHYICTAHDVRFCDDDCGSITVVLREDSPDQELLRKLKSNKINDPLYFNDPNKIPKFNFCVTHAHSWIQHMLIALGLIVMMVLVPLITSLQVFVASVAIFLILICVFIVQILTLLWLLISAFNIIVGFVNWVITQYNSIPLLPNLPTLNWQIPNINIVPPGCQTLFSDPFAAVGNINDFKKDVARFLISCDDKHPSPLIRYYLDIMVQMNGASGWQSSYFGNPSKPHYNMCLLNAPVNNGDPNPPTIYADNLPGWTCAQALDAFCTLINGRWFIDNLTIYIERKDFNLSQPMWFDAVTNKSKIIEGACYTFSDQKPYASLKVSYTYDMREESGNEIAQEYKAEVSYEQLHGYNPAWEDRNEITIPFSPVRVRNDGARPIIKYDPLTWWQVVINPLSATGKAIKASSKYLMMQKGTTQVPKVVIWDVASGVNDAQVQEYLPHNYNDPMKFKPGTQGLFYPVPNGTMYDDYAILDPSITPYKRFRFQIKIQFDCQLFLSARPGKTINLSRGIGVIDDYKIELGKSITVTGSI